MIKLDRHESDLPSYFAFPTEHCTKFHPLKITVSHTDKTVKVQSFAKITKKGELRPAIGKTTDYNEFQCNSILYNAKFIDKLGVSAQNTFQEAKGYNLDKKIMLAEQMSPNTELNRLLLSKEFFTLDDNKKIKLVFAFIHHAITTFLYAFQQGYLLDDHRKNNVAISYAEHNPETGSLEAFIKRIDVVPYLAGGIIKNNEDDINISDIFQSYQQFFLSLIHLYKEKIPSELASSFETLSKLFNQTNMFSKDKMKETFEAMLELKDIWNYSANPREIAQWLKIPEKPKATTMDLTVRPNASNTLNNIQLAFYNLKRRREEEEPNPNTKKKRVIAKPKGLK